jgi:hypothetical protein
MSSQNSPWKRGSEAALLAHEAELALANRAQALVGRAGADEKLYMRSSAFVGGEIGGDHARAVRAGRGGLGGSPAGSRASRAGESRGHRGDWLRPSNWRARAHGKRDWATVFEML